MIKCDLETHPIKQGIIGIQLPEMVAAATINNFVNNLFYQVDVEAVVIPPPLINKFSQYSNKDVETIGRRVERDRDNSLSHNRLHLAFYWDSLGVLNKESHDVFFHVKDRENGGFEISVS